jgi:hypothetical protein
LPVAAGAVVVSGVRRRGLTTKIGHAMTTPVDRQQFPAKLDTIRRFIDDATAAWRCASPTEEMRPVLAKTRLNFFALAYPDHAPLDPAAEDRCFASRGQVIDALRTFGYDITAATNRVEELLTELSRLASCVSAGGVKNLTEAFDTDVKICTSMLWLSACEEAISAGLGGADGGASFLNKTLPVLLREHAGGRPGRPVCRVRVEGGTVFVDDQPVTLNLTDETRGPVLEYLSRMIDAMGAWVSGGDMGKAHEGLRWDRLFRRQPAALRNLIQTKKFCGRRLRRTAWN